MRSDEGPRCVQSLPRAVDKVSVSLKIQRHCTIIEKSRRTPDATTAQNLFEEGA